MPPIHLPDDVCLRIEHTTDDKLTDGDWESFITALRETCQRYDFKLRQWGSWKEMGEYYLSEKAFIEQKMCEYPEQPEDREVA